jgi:hypothetical protein
MESIHIIDMAKYALKVREIKLLQRPLLFKKLKGKMTIRRTNS